MSSKTIDIIVLEEEQPQRVLLSEVTLNLLPERFNFLMKGKIRHTFWPKMRTIHTCTSLTQNYLSGINNIYKTFIEIVTGTDYEDKINYDLITSIPFAYATPKAYQKIKPIPLKEKETDKEVVPVGHFEAKNGIVLSLENNITPESIIGSIIHEHGHYLHYSLWKEEYQKCDVTMRELMAIFVQEKYYPIGAYKEKTPHHRAQELLHRLENKESYARSDSASQWNFLLQFMNHQELNEHIDKLL